MMKHLPRVFLWAAGCLFASPTWSQEPVTLADNPLAGLIDFHVHSGPDSFTRSITDLEIARIAKDRRMGALVLKNHFTMTADRAVLAERLTGQTCYGGIVLNRALGGLNAEAIRRMVTFTGGRGKVVWLPTFDAENHVKSFGEKRPAVQVVKDEKPVPELNEIFELVAQHDLVLETGHSSAEECLILIRAARRAGVQKILVTHAMADPIGMTVEQMKKAAAMGAKLECVWLTNITGPTSHLASMRHWRQVTTAEYAKAMREVGPQHFVVASDLGQYLNPIPTDGMKAFVLGLREAGFEDGEIDLMCRLNPGRLLGMLEDEKPIDLGWRKHTINDQSPFEAAGAADFNGDGLLDVFSGDSWYEAPKWTRHKVRTVAPGTNPHYYEDFADLPLDVNGDGNVDIVTCAYFSRRIGWVEHPGDPSKAWIEHTVDRPGSMETGQLVDLNSDGKLDFLPNVGGIVSWYELTAQKPSVKWVKHELGNQGAGHGVGIGDVNRDGKTDIITPKGWYEQPADASTAWPFHADFELGAASVLIIGRDFDGDGDTDILWGMGHDYGLFWLRQSAGAGGNRVWIKERVDTTFSQVHTLHLADLDGDLRPEVVTGKRIYAHETEPGATDAPCIYSFHFDREDSRWIKRVIYEGKPVLNAPQTAKDRWALKDFDRGSAGTGLQMDARDMDGDGDIDLVCPGKSGLYWFENLRLSKATPATSPTDG